MPLVGVKNRKAGEKLKGSLLLLYALNYTGLFFEICCIDKSVGSAHG